MSRTRKPAVVDGWTPAEWKQRLKEWDASPEAGVLLTVVDAVITEYAAKHAVGPKTQSALRAQCLSEFSLFVKQRD